MTEKKKLIISWLCLIIGLFLIVSGFYIKYQYKKYSEATLPLPVDVPSEVSQ